MLVILLLKKNVKNALSGAQEANVPYIRYERESQTFHQPGITVVENYEIG